MTYTLQILLILCIIIVAAKATGSLFVRWGQPGVLGEILIGLILGPTLLNLPSWGIFADNAYYRNELEKLSQAAHQKQLHAYIQNPSQDNEKLEDIVQNHEEQYERKLQGASTHGGLIPFVKDLAAIGVIFLMFIAGVETDLKQMRRVGMVAFWAAAGGVVLPFIAGWAISSYMGHYNIYEALFVGAILTATSVSISAQTLMELKALRSKEGTTILGAAVIDDVMGIIILSLVIAFKPRSVSMATHNIALPDIITNGLGNIFSFDNVLAGKVKIIILIVLMILFFIAAWLLGMKYFDKWSSRVRHWPSAEAFTAFVIFMCLFYAWSAEFIGSVAAITGAYMAGLLFAQTSFKEEIKHKFSVITYSIFVPIFFVSLGLDADARPLFAPIAQALNGKGFPGVENFGWPIFWLTIAIIVAAIVTKVIGCYLGALFKGFSRLESFRVGVGMISRGEVGLIVATVGLASGIIDRNIFTIMILMVLVTTLVTPVFLKLVFSKFGAVELIGEEE